MNIMWVYASYHPTSVDIWHDTLFFYKRRQTGNFIQVHSPVHDLIVKYTWGRQWR
jgi:hypothetical protein